MYFSPVLINRDDKDYKINMTRWGEDQLDIVHSLWEPINPNGGEALGIYNHSDGYPGGVGEALLEHYNTYEQALNLVLGGNCSSIIDSYQPYALRDGEDWENIKPEIMDEDMKLDWVYDYGYMFKDGMWYVCDDCELKNWHPLDKYLEKYGE